MKLRYLLISSLLLIGCNGKINDVVEASEELVKYTNVAYQITREEDSIPCYYVYLEDYNKDTGKYEITKEWKTPLDSVKHLFFSYYIYTDTNELLNNEFYVKGNSNTLILYHYFNRK